MPKVETEEAPFNEGEVLEQRETSVNNNVFTIELDESSCREIKDAMIPLVCTLNHLWPVESNRVSQSSTQGESCMVSAFRRYLLASL